MQFQTNPQSIRSLISRRMQFAFIAGLLIGILLGWAFSGVVSAVMRFGILTILLIPLVLALIFWWNVRRAPKRNGTTIVTWGSSTLPPMEDDVFRTTGSSRTEMDDEVIDLEELRREREP